MAYPGTIRITPFHRIQRRFRLDLEHRHVSLRIVSDQLRPQRRLVGKGHSDLSSIGDDMVVGNDETAGIDNETGAERRRARPRPVLRCFALAIEEVAEEFLERRSRRKLRYLRRVPLKVLPLLRRRDIDHCRHQPIRKISEILRPTSRLSGKASGQKDNQQPYSGDSDTAWIQRSILQYGSARPNSVSATRERLQGRGSPPPFQDKGPWPDQPRIAHTTATPRQAAINPPIRSVEEVISCAFRAIFRIWSGNNAQAAPSMTRTKANAVHRSPISAVPLVRSAWSRQNSEKTRYPATTPWWYRRCRAPSDRPAWSGRRRRNPDPG